MNNFKKVMASVLSLVMVLCCVCVPAFAMEDTMAPTIANHPEDTTMVESTKVFAIGNKAFYKVEADGVTVVYSDIDAEGFLAVPSAYIKGSQYNEGDVDFGMYVAGGKVHFVPVADCYDDGAGQLWFYHGTEDGATVSEATDGVSNEDPTMSTQFYINIDNGIDPNGTTTEDMVLNATDDARVNYEITVATKSTYQLDATIPMYVCMYGYRGTGNIITPTAEAYRMKNYSTVNESTDATIVDIVKLTSYARIYDEDHSNEELVAIAYDKVNHTYRYWYSEATDYGFTADEEVFMIKDEGVSVNASGECYVICIDKDGDGTFEWDFKASGVLDDDTLRETVAAVEEPFALAADFIFEEWNFGTTPYVGQVIEDQNASTEGLAIKVTELQAEPATWRIVPVSTPVSELRRGEIAMSLAPEKAQSNASAIDLAECSRPLDITENGWFLDEPTMNGETVAAPAELGLITWAQMAGSNVNDAGCTPVVKVSYTVTPMFSIDDTQINTIIGGGVAAN